MRMGAHGGAEFNGPRSTMASGGVHEVVTSASTCLHGFSMSLPMHFSVVALINRGAPFAVRRVRRTFCPPV